MHYYRTDSIELAIQCIAGNVPGFNVVRLGPHDSDTWDYEFRMRTAREELHLKPREKMNSLLARKYVYAHLKEEDLPEPVKEWFKEIKAVEEKMAEFNDFMNQIASGEKMLQPTLVSMVNKYFSVTIPKSAKVKDIVDFVLTGKKMPMETFSKKTTEKLRDQGMLDYPVNKIQPKIDEMKAKMSIPKELTPNVAKKRKKNKTNS